MSYLDEYWDVQWTDGQWYNLHQFAYHVETIYGSRTNVPRLRGSNVAVYGRPGRLHQPKMADQRTIALRGWVSDRDPDDKPYPSGICGEGLNTNWRMIRRLLWRENGEQFNLRRRWYDESGAVISAVAKVEYAGGLELTDHVGEAGRWTCDLNLSDPYFYGDVETVTLTRNTPKVLTNIGDVPVFQMTLDFQNELVNPRVTNSTPSPDVWVRVGSSIDPGDNVMLDVGQFTATRGSDSANLIGAISRSGARPWMVFVPGNNLLTLTATSGTGTVDVTWRPAYL